MKKITIAWLLIASLALSSLLTACGDSETETTAAPAETTTEPAVTATVPTETTTEAVSTEETPDVPTEPEKVSLEGKTIVWLGSSVTYGSANNGVSMADYLANAVGCKSVKWAVSGTTLYDNDSNSYVSRLKSQGKRQKTCDYFICQLSTNDASQNKPLGSVSDSFDMADFDVHTVCGAIEYIIAYAKDKWDCPVAFYTGPRYNSAAYQAMVDALLQIQEKWGIYILDFWNDPDFHAMTPRDQQKWLSKYMADDIHPNAKGYEDWWTPAFEEFISTTIGK